MLVCLVSFYIYINVFTYWITFATSLEDYIPNELIDGVHWCSKLNHTSVDVNEDGARLKPVPWSTSIVPSYHIYMISEFTPGDYRSPQWDQGSALV